MYAVKVKGVRQSPEDAELSEEASRLASELLAEQALETRGSTDHIQDEVAFSVGNPRVEHLTGKVHLYRQVTSEPLSHQLPVSSAIIVASSASVKHVFGVGTADNGCMSIAD